MANKIDEAKDHIINELIENHSDVVFISARQKKNLDELKSRILALTNVDKFKTGNTIVTNVRHYDSLVKTRDSLLDILTGLDQEVTNDFVAMDIRRSLHFLGEITGQITTDDLLANIFSKFCIGK